MKTLLLSISILIITGCSNAQTVKEQKDLRTDVVTSYPNRNTDNSGTFRDERVQAKLGYPDESGSKVWVKGSKAYSNAQILSANKEVLQTTTLSAPHYTHLFTELSNNTELYVNFISDNDSISEKISTGSLSSLLDESENYSIAFYGCFQPFTVNKNTFESSLFNTENNFPKRFTRTFANSILQNGSNDVNSILPNTKLLIGTGDQVYMDAGYHTVKADGIVPHPISGWTTTKFQSELLRTPEGYDDHIEKTYRAFGSIKDLNDVTKAIPQVNAWDDHEIRDGWGSQEDEYNSDQTTLSEKFKPAFMATKKAFIEHQLLTGPRSEDANKLYDNLSTMEQTFQVGKYKGIALDLRTARNILDPRVMGENQKNAFKNWLDNIVSDGDSIIIVSTMPIFLSNYSVVEKFANKTRSDSKDDVNDGWASDENKTERNEILSMLLDARIKRDIKPIFVSGDYHKGALSEIWYGEEGKDGEGGDCTKSREKNKKVFGYELLASGLYHEGIVDDYTALGFDKIESQRLGKHFIREIPIKSSETKYCLDPFVSMSVVQENFGGLEVTKEGNDRLKLVAGNGKDNTADIFYLPLDWEKNFIPENEKLYKGFYQNFTKYLGWIFNIDSFTPRMPKSEEIKLDDI